MSADKYPSVFSHQMEAIIYIDIIYVHVCRNNMVVTKYYISFLIHLENNSTDILQFINSRTDGYVIVKFCFGQDFNYVCTYTHVWVNDQM